MAEEWTEIEVAEAASGAETALEAETVMIAEEEEVAVVEWTTETTGQA